MALHRGTTLSLDVPDGRVGGRFEAIAVRNATFVGTTADGRTVETNLARVRAASTSTPDLVGTLTWVAVALVVGGAAAFAWTHWGGSHSEPVRVNTAP